MDKTIVCFKRRGICMQRAFDAEEKAIKYIRRWIGEIKDFRIYPNFYANADCIKIEIEDRSYVDILTPLGQSTKIKEILL